jgi:hypothetical protein
VSDFSKTAMKRIRRMSKNELISMVVQISNYAEQQKAENILLVNALKIMEAQKTENKQEVEQPQNTKQGEIL